MPLYPFSRIPRGIPFIILALLFQFLPTSFATAQYGTPTADEAPSIFGADGITSSLIASASATGGPGTLVLQRIELPPTSGMPQRIALGPEIFIREQGELTITDDFSFSSVLPSDASITINAGAAYALSNEGEDPVTFMRVGLEVEVEESAGDAQVTTLLSVPIEGIPNTEATLFIARVNIEPGSSTGELLHDGPVGIFVVEGSLKVVSPSGIEGDIAGSSGVSLPMDTPLQARSESGAAIILVGLVNDAVGLLYAAPEASTPTLNPPPEPASTPLPKEIPTPTAPPSTPTVAVPTPTLVPTETPTMPPTIAPTPETYSGNLFDLMPPVGQLPRGLWVAEQGALSKETITSTFTDPAMASRFFDEWGWEANAYSAFEGAPTVDGLLYVDVGIHRFSNISGAVQALDYYANIRGQQMGLSDVAMRPLGDQSRAIVGVTGSGTEASVYVRMGGIVVRVSVMSVSVDPLIVAEAVATMIVERAGR